MGIPFRFFVVTGSGPFFPSTDTETETKPTRTIDMAESDEN